MKRIEKELRRLAGSQDFWELVSDSVLDTLIEAANTLEAQELEIKELKRVNKAYRMEVAEYQYRYFSNGTGELLQNRQNCDVDMYNNIAEYYHADRKRVETRILYVKTK